MITKRNETGNWKWRKYRYLVLIILSMIFINGCSFFRVTSYEYTFFLNYDDALCSSEENTENLLLMIDSIADSTVLKRDQMKYSGDRLNRDNSMKYYFWYADRHSLYLGCTIDEKEIKVWQVYTNADLLPLVENIRTQLLIRNIPFELKILERSYYL